MKRFSLKASAIVAALGFVVAFSACQSDISPDIGWVATADSATNTRHINFAFNAGVDALDVSDIVVATHGGTVNTGELSGGGRLWSLEVLGITQVTGNVTVSINRNGISGRPQVVQIGNTVTTVAIAAVGVATDPVAISFTFGQPVAGFDIGHIRVVEDTGLIELGTLEGSGTQWRVPVTVVRAGYVRVWVEKPGISANAQPLNFTPITWTATLGISVASAPTINFAFDRPVMDLTAGDITVGDGTGAVTVGALRQLATNGMVWALDVTVIRAGAVLVSIDKPGIQPGGQAPVGSNPVWEAAPVTVSFFGATVSAVNAPLGATRTERLNFVFDVPVELTAANIVIEVAGGPINNPSMSAAVVQTNLYGNGTHWTLLITPTGTAGGGTLAVGLQNIPGMAPGGITWFPLISVTIPTP